MSTATQKQKTIKCIVWDLDNTLWRGVLLEDAEVALRPGLVEIIQALDARGILQSVASKNDPTVAQGKLEALGLADYFLHPQIGWNAKAGSIKAIAEALNIGLDTFAFVDDDPYERGEVAFSLPEVLCIDAADLSGLLARPEMNPRFITEDSARRRLMYLGDMKRKVAEESFAGPPEAFLATLGMSFTIARAREEDLRRAEELTLRTNQLNTTGVTYAYEELQGFMRSDDHELLIASLTDVHGDYGKIGLALVKREPGLWHLQLLLMSCRVMSRGVGTILLNHIMAEARRHGAQLRADFVETDRNRMMYVTYRFAGFREVARDGQRSILENDLSRIQDPPPYVRVQLPEDHRERAPARPDLTPEQRALLDRWMHGDAPEVPAGDPLRPAGLGPEAPASFAQERLWFLERLQPGTPIYNEPLALRLRGALDLPALTRALTALLERHDVLRTTYAIRDGKLRQTVLAPTPFPLPLTDLTGRPPGERLGAAIASCVEESRRPFDLATGPVVRGRLLRLDGEDHILLLVLHHIACDGWSLDLLMRELSAFYRTEARGEAVALPQLPLRYADYAAWQRKWLDSAPARDALAYWRQQLAGLEPLDIPTDHPRPPVQSHTGRTHTFALPAVFSEQLTALCREHRVTPFMALLAVFQVLLCRHAGQTDIAVGTPVAGRVRTELEPLVGFFVNMLVLRVDLSGDPSFAELLARVREVTLGAYAHQELPFEKLVEELQPKRDLARQPLFQVMFGLHNVQRTDLDLPGIDADLLDIDRGATKFDLSLYLVETEQGLRGLLEHSTDLFDPDTAARIAGQFGRLLEAALANPGCAIGRLPWLTADERAERLRASNAATSNAATDVTAEEPTWDGLCMHQVVEAAVARHPERIALATERTQLTFRQLDERARAWARDLRAAGVGPGVPVGIAMERSPEMVLAALAILKAGGAYVPLDPSHPRARLSVLLRQTRVPLVLTQRRLRHELPETEARILCVEDTPGATDDAADAPDDARATTRDGDADPLAPAAGPDDLAYIIFTSGSSGAPKGAMITHRGLVCLVEAQLDAFRIGPESRVLQCASFSFDASASEIFTALSAGATLWLGPPEPVVAGAELQRLLEDAAITVVTLSPSVLATLTPAPLPALRTLVSAGEACPAALVRRWAPGRRFVNAYGPTEATIGATFSVLDTSDPSGEAAPPIGRPFRHARVHVLDPHLEPVPTGVPGEIYLGGPQVCRGYLHQPALTAARFVPDPFSDRPGARLYRTGDRARGLPDGQLDYLGRADSQTKIRGVRIEPGEVEAALREHPAVKDALVVAREDAAGALQLVAYVVASPTAAAGGPDAPLPSPQAFRDHLAERVPRPHLPAAFVPLDALPLTPNGKIDLRALPAPDTAYRHRTEAPTAPRDTLELELVQIWEDLLDVRPIGVHDDFFTLGGHSLLAVRLEARIRQRLDRDVPVSTLFQAPTIDQLARKLRQQAPPLPRSPLVAVQPRGERTPFFCVHPVGGSVLCYVDLARRLGLDRPFYGLRSPGLHGERAPCEDISEMAALYLEAMRERQPRGPYLLGGWSMGGSIAFEMARMLLAEGEHVALLALIDSHALAPVDLRDGIDDTTLVSLFVLDLARQAGASLPSWGAALDGAEPAQRPALVLDHARAAGLIPPDLDPASVDQTLRVFRGNLLAHCRYTPRPAPVRATLFCGSDPSGWSTGSPDLGWTDLALGGLTLDVLPGDHYALLTDQAEALARRLRARLDAADAPPRRERSSPLTTQRLHGEP
ncbi:non-ribosomal peptide synthetase [Chondromyces apiculatus]|uniref:Long-chain-fatty-acid--CoA ligase n=1 Tax=Chondromyces apiculatus DSM 436 TaxID=1192034 RepID=A0A017T3B5_9BACT|nr:non-ribosomal peptide synthetase [Chondromyces apiculatus]EYF03728.1 Long-chain-fatty-acid--CoA ligase [Chondromyces apiculatus DSM 436]